MENLLIYALIVVALYFVFKREEKDEKWVIKRESDLVIEVVSGKMMLKEKR